MSSPQSSQDNSQESSNHTNSHNVIEFHTNSQKTWETRNLKKLDFHRARKLNYQKNLNQPGKRGGANKESGNTQLHAVRTFICTTLHLSQCHHKCNARFIRHFATAKRNVLARYYCCYCSLTQLCCGENGDNWKYFCNIIYCQKLCRYQQKCLAQQIVQTFSACNLLYTF